MREFTDRMQQSWTALGTNAWTGNGYPILRGLLGAYLLVHFAMLVPFAAELFSTGGMLSDASLSPFHGAVPNPLAHFDAPWMVTAAVALGAFAAVLLALGIRDRAAALFLWLLLACLFMRNPLIANPSLPYVGWLLLAHTLVPTAPSLSSLLRRRGRPRERSPSSECAGFIPNALFASAWIVMSVGYTYSGLTKLASPSWRDGSAVAHVLENPLARPTALRDWILSLPESWLALASYGALGLEVGFLGLAISRRLRPWSWLAMTGMHLGLIVLVDFADLSVGMLMLHAFTFDPAWLTPMQRWGRRVLNRRVAAAAIGGMALFALVVPANVAPSEAVARDADHTEVIITNDGIRHAGLVLPSHEGPVEFGFGDLQWFALGRTKMWRAPSTLLLPSQGVTSRRPLPDDELARLGREHGYLCRRYEVPTARAEALLISLSAEFEPDVSEARIRNHRHQMEFVPNRRRYSIFFNCHDQVARWLRALGVRARPLPLRLRPPSGMEPCDLVIAEPSVDAGISRSDASPGLSAD